MHVNPCELHLLSHRWGITKSTHWGFPNLKIAVELAKLATLCIHAYNLSHIANPELGNTGLASNTGLTLLCAYGCKPHNHRGESVFSPLYWAQSDQ